MGQEVGKVLCMLWELYASSQLEQQKRKEKESLTQVKEGSPSLSQMASG